MADGTRVPFNRRCQVCGDPVKPLEMWQEVVPDGLVRGHEKCCKRVALAGNKEAADG